MGGGGANFRKTSRHRPSRAITAILARAKPDLRSLWRYATKPSGHGWIHRLTNF